MLIREPEEKMATTLDWKVVLTDKTIDHPIKGLQPRMIFCPGINLRLWLFSPRRKLPICSSMCKVGPGPFSSFIFNVNLIVHIFEQETGVQVLLILTRRTVLQVGFPPAPIVPFPYEEAYNCSRDPL